AAEDPELEATRLGQAREHGHVAAAVGRPLLGDDEDLRGAVRPRRQPLDRGGLRVIELRRRVAGAEIGGHVATRASGALALEILRRTDVGDVLLECHPGREPLRRDHTRLALHHALLYRLGTGLAAGLGGTLAQEAHGEGARTLARGGLDAAPRRRR